MTGSIWATLGISPTNDANDIRRAYARRLKVVHPEDDPDGFQALRAAFEQATSMAKNGWAVPPPPGQYDDDEDEAFDDWPDVEPQTRRSQPDVPPPPTETSGATPPDLARDWSIGSPAPTPDVPDEVRAELDREQDLVRTHKALCDRLADLIANPDGDRHEALSALLAIFRSPGMDSLQTHVQTEHWLAWVIGSGGPAADDLVEPAIQFFGWDNRPIGVDLSHAGMALQRREAAVVLRRLERPDDPDHAAWQAISQRPTFHRRLRQRFTLRLETRVYRLLDRIDYQLVGLIPKTDPAAVSGWRRRRHRALFSATFLWTLVILPVLVAGAGVISGLFGPPDPMDALALWAASFAGLTGLGAILLHSVIRPKQRWRDGGWAWGQPAWIRLGWAPVAIVVLMVSSIVPGDLPWVAGWWLALGPLVVWTTITNAHFEESRAGLRTGFFMAMLPLAWLVVHAHGAPWVSLCWVATGVTLVAHHGRPALEDAWLSLSNIKRHLSATALALLTIGAMAAVATVPVQDGDWSLRTIAAAALMIPLLASRPIRFTQTLLAQKVWFNWMRLGWLPCAVAVWFSPYTDMASATFVAAGAWLAGGALITFVWEAAPRLDDLLSGRKRRR